MADLTVVEFRQPEVQRLPHQDWLRLQRDVRRVVGDLQQRVRRCPCGLWFYQRHKQRYCTPACSQRVRTARWQAKGRHADGR